MIRLTRWPSHSGRVRLSALLTCALVCVCVCVRVRPNNFKLIVLRCATRRRLFGSALDFACLRQFAARARAPSGAYGICLQIMRTTPAPVSLQRTSFVGLRFRRRLRLRPLIETSANELKQWQVRACSLASTGSANPLACRGASALAASPSASFGSLETPNASALRLRERPRSLRPPSRESPLACGGGKRSFEWARAHAQPARSRARVFLGDRRQAPSV